MNAAYFTKLMALGLLIHLIVNAAISYAVAAWFFPNDKLIMFLVFLGALVILPILFKLKDLIIKSISAYMRFGATVDYVRAELRNGDIPNSGDYGYFDVDFFLRQVSEDDDLSVRTRMKAVELHTMLQTTRSSGNFVAAMTLSAALAKAIRKHWADG